MRHSTSVRVEGALPRTGSARRDLVPAAAAAWRDILDGLAQWRLWYLLGSSDMRRRYARSRLGQFWIMVSSAVMISTLGLVWSYLWQLPVAEMLPFVAVSLIVWQLLSGIITEAATLLPKNAHYFLNQYTPASTIILSLIYRQGFTFLLNIIFPIGLALALGTPLTLELLLVIPGMLLLAIASFWMAFVVAILSTRFRDMIQLVNSIMQSVMFLTPVLWKPELLSASAQPLIMLNPFAVLMAVVRDPLLGRPMPLSYWLAAIAIAIGGLVLSLPFIGRYRRRLIYWL